MKLPPVSSQKKRRDQTTVTSIRCQGYWFQPIWRKQVIISKYESTQHRKGKLTKSQWSSAVSILTPAFHIWGTQQKDAIKLKKKKRPNQYCSRTAKRYSFSYKRESHISAQLQFPWFIYFSSVIHCFVSGFVQLSVRKTDCGSFTDTLWQVIYFHL